MAGAATDADRGGPRAHRAQRRRAPAPRGGPADRPHQRAARRTRRTPQGSAGQPEPASRTFIHRTSWPPAPVYPPRPSCGSVLAMSEGLQSPVFVGRGDEVAALTALWTGPGRASPGSRSSRARPASARRGWSPSWPGRRRFRVHRADRPLRRARRRGPAAGPADRRAAHAGPDHRREASWPRCSARPGGASAGCCPSSTPARGWKTAAPSRAPTGSRCPSSWSWSSGCSGGSAPPGRCCWSWRTCTGPTSPPGSWSPS